MEDQVTRLRTRPPETSEPLASLEPTPAHDLRKATEEWEQTNLLRIPRANLDIEEQSTSAGAQARRCYHGRVRKVREVRGSC